MTRQPFYETDNERRWWLGITGRVLLAVVIIGLIVGGVGLVRWAFFTGTASIRGRAEAHRTIESGTNRIEKQELFQQLLADSKGYVQQIKVQKAALDDAIAAGDPDATRLRSVVAGLRSQCVSTEQQYNAEANKVSAARFRDAGLPHSLTADDPNIGDYSTLDCIGASS